MEAVADDVAFWIETTSREVARSMMDGVYAPFSARVSAQEQARYYAETLFTPQGQLDPEVWRKEYARLGPEGLARAINGAAGYRRSRGLPVLLPVSRFQPTGSQMTLPSPAAGMVLEGEGPPLEGASPGVPGMQGPGMMGEPAEPEPEAPPAPQEY